MTTLTRTPQCNITLMKIIKVIKSCQTYEQLEVAFNMINRITCYEQWIIVAGRLSSHCQSIVFGDVMIKKVFREQKLRLKSIK